MTTAMLLHLPRLKGLLSLFTSSTVCPDDIMIGGVKCNVGITSSYFLVMDHKVWGDWPSGQETGAILRGQWQVVTPTQLYLTFPGTEPTLYQSLLQTSGNFY